MKCVEVEKILDRFVGDELNVVMRQKIDLHLNECADCRREAKNLQNSVHLLKKLPLIAPSNQLDAQMMQAFRKHQENQNRTGFWTAFFSRFSISKPALACSALLLVAFTALAFQIGKMSAPVNEIANYKTPESSLPIVQIVEKRVEIPVVKAVEVPVYREKVVTRIVYKNREFTKIIKISERQNKELSENDFNLQNTATNFVQNGNEKFTPINLKSFQPVSEIRMNIIKRGKNDEN